MINDDFSKIANIITLSNNDLLIFTESNLSYYRMGSQNPEKQVNIPGNITAWV